MKKYIKDIRKKTIKEIEKEIVNLKKDIVKSNIEWKINKPKDTNLISNKKKKLAVLMTVLYEMKELEKIRKSK
jgi:ribosomal protein L29